MISHKYFRASKAVVVRLQRPAGFGHPRAERKVRRVGYMTDERHSCTLREPPSEGAVVRVVDAGQRRVERDDGAWSEFGDESEECLSLRFRRRRIAGAEEDIAFVLDRAAMRDRVRLPVPGRK